MSGLIDKAKAAIQGQSGDTSSAGSYQKPSEFSTKSQKGQVVGLQHEMADQPESTGMESGSDDGYSTYKAAGKLEGKTAIVTGGDSGIGRSVAVMFAMEGAKVAIFYLPEEEKDAQMTKSLALRYGGRDVITHAFDIRSETAVNAAVEGTVQELGGTLDILVNNASVMYDTASIEEITSEQFDRTMKTNIYGSLFYMTRAAVKYIPKGGSIINTVSQVAYAGSPSLLDYSITKGAGVAFTRSLSKNLISKGIRVNGVAPGPVWTPLQPGAMTDEKLESWQNSPAPMGRIGQPAELAPSYIFLASKDGSFFTGQVLHANGGTVING